MYRGGAAHTGDLTYETPVSEKPEPLWKFNYLNKGIHTASKSSPVVDEAALYVGADNGFFYAFDRFNGRVLWEFKAKRSIFGIHSSPAVDAETVYFGAYNGYLYALDKTTGAVKWKRRLGDSIGSSPVLFEDKIYIGVELNQPNRGFLAAVRISDGKKSILRPEICRAYACYAHDRRAGENRIFRV
jgi:outer membrane protein assembly factor BamB